MDSNDSNTPGTLDPESAFERLYAAGTNLSTRKSIACQWRDNALESQELIPGTAATGEEFLIEAGLAAQGVDSGERPCVSEAMSGKECKAFLRSAFGAPCAVEADVGRCEIWRFDVEGATFIALWRSGRGLRWEWVKQEGLPPVAESEARRSHGKLVLLSHDKGAPSEWRSFCRLMGSAVSLGCPRAASLRERLILEGATPRSAAAKTKPKRC